MALFGSSSSPAEDWPIDVLTPDFLIAGRIEAAAQKWGWSYFATAAPTPAQELRVTVDAVRATGGLAAPEWTGRTASFAYATGLVALIASAAPTVAVWNEWASGTGTPVQAQFIAGPYAITGTAITPDGSLQALLSDRVAIANAAVTRLDAPDAPPIPMPCGMLATRSVQAAVAL